MPRWVCSGVATAGNRSTCSAMPRAAWRRAASLQRSGSLSRFRQKIPSKHSNGFAAGSPRRHGGMAHDEPDRRRVAPARQQPARAQLDLGLVVEEVEHRGEGTGREQHVAVDAADHVGVGFAEAALPGCGRAVAVAVDDLETTRARRRRVNSASAWIVWRAPSSPPFASTPTQSRRRSRGGACSRRSGASTAFLRWRDVRGRGRGRGCRRGRRRRGRGRRRRSRRGSGGGRRRRCRRGRGAVAVAVAVAVPVAVTDDRGRASWPAASAARTDSTAATAGRARPAATMRRRNARRSLSGVRSVSGSSMVRKPAGLGVAAAISREQDAHPAQPGHARAPHLGERVRGHEREALGQLAGDVGHGPACRRTARAPSKPCC